MGMIRDVKVKQIADTAARAYAEGRTVFAARFNAPARLGDATGSVGDWAEMIEAVEEQGWALTEWTVAEGKGPAAYPLFRRRR